MSILFLFIIALILGGLQISDVLVAVLAVYHVCTVRFQSVKIDRLNLETRKPTPPSRVMSDAMPLWWSYHSEVSYTINLASCSHYPSLHCFSVAENWMKRLPTRRRIQMWSGLPRFRPWAGIFPWRSCCFSSSMRGPPQQKSWRAAARWAS